MRRFFRHFPLPMQKRAELNSNRILISSPAAGLVVGLTVSVFGHFDWASWILAGSTLPVLAVLTFEIVSTLRRGDVGLDIVALLSMSAALIFGEQLAACVVALMYAGGQYLEELRRRPGAPRDDGVVVTRSAKCSPSLQRRTYECSDRRACRR